jgi:hypothetical protein
VLEVGELDLGGSGVTSDRVVSAWGERDGGGAEFY